MVFSVMFYCSSSQWRGESEGAGEAARLMAPPPIRFLPLSLFCLLVSFCPVIRFLPVGLGRVSCRRHNMQ